MCIEVMNPVLVVDDEPIVRDVVCRYLERDGLQTIEAGNGQDALACIEEHHPSLVVLDVMLPGVDGIEVCRQIRRGSQTPVILLTALGAEDDRIDGLEAGADDYVVKPFSPREVALRVRSILRRTVCADDELVGFGDVVIDRANRTVHRDGAEVHLTAREFDLLVFLAQNARRVFTRDQLMSRVWGYEAALDTGTVTVHVRRLREKLEANPASPRHIQTVWGVGYRFVV